MFLLILGCFEAVVLLSLQNPVGLGLADLDVPEPAWILELI